MAINGIRIGKMKNSSMTNCTAVCDGTGFNIGEADNCKLEGLLSITPDALRQLNAIQDFIVQNKNSIEKDAGEEKYQEIINELAQLKDMSKTSVSEITDRFLSIGANSLTIWPALLEMVNKLPL